MAENRDMRTCSKTACRWPAAASLSYRYDTRQAWLLDLSEEPDPSLYDLCPHHADALVVMRGWERVDQRTHAEPVVEPAGRDLLPGSGRPPVGPGGYGNRYTELVEDLPRLAALLADVEPDAPLSAAPEPVVQDGDGVARAQERRAQVAGAEGARAEDGAAEDAASAAPPLPSRDLAPMGVPERAEPHGPRAARAAAQAALADEVPGQLAIPVPEVDGAAIGEAVVVSISAASGRRRAPASR
jgi:hypothetical protein